MKIAIISDLHLTTKFHEDKYNFLVDLINKYDQIIVNGDLWDGQIISFDQFLESEWKRLFPLLKEKKCVYIYGNHDEESMQDDRHTLFCEISTERYELPLENSDKILIIKHGDKLVKLPFTNLRTNRTFHTIVKIPNIIRINFEDWVGKMIHWEKNKYSFWNRTPTQVVKKLQGAEWDNKILVASHFHDPKFTPENRYINTGMIMQHQASYLTITDGKMKLLMETY